MLTHGQKRHSDDLLSSKPFGPIIYILCKAAHTPGSPPYTIAHLPHYSMHIPQESRSEDVAVVSAYVDDMKGSEGNVMSVTVVSTSPDGTGLSVAMSDNHAGLASTCVQVILLH